MNAAGSRQLRKGNTLPDGWFKDGGEAYLDQHLIPHDPALWELDRFEDFVAERERLIKAKFGYLLSSAVIDTAVPMETMEAPVTPLP
jgi:hypothetical protein